MAENASPAPSPGTGLHVAVRGLRVVAGLLSVAIVVIVLWVVIARFVHPAETEWMTGSIRDGVDRVKAGEPLYDRPSVSFVAYIYPPLYFWLSALVGKVASTTVACRLVSIAATIATCVAITRIARALGGTKPWAFASAVLYIGTFSYTMYCFDLERVDALEGGIASCGVALLLGEGEKKRELLRAAGAGALLALAYFAKQPGLFIFVAAVTGLLVAKEWRRAIVVLGAGLLTALVVGAYLQTTSHGWFSFYALKLPASHGIKGSLVSLFWVVDAPKGFVLTAASVGFIGWVAYGVFRRTLPPWRDVTFASVVGGAMVGAFLLRAHEGGWINVLIAWTPFGCAAAAVAASRAMAAFEEPRARAAVEIGLLAAFSLQLALWSFDPDQLAPGRGDDAFDAELSKVVRTLEKEGEVVVTATGGLSTPRHFHAAALYDVLRAGEAPPADYLEALRARKFAAMVVSTPNETMCAPAGCLATTTAVMENYYVASRLPNPPRSSRVGFEARSTWVIRPRRTPLTGLPIDKLDTRQRNEAAIADMQAIIEGPKYDPALPHADVEELGAAATAAVGEK